MPNDITNKAKERSSKLGQDLASDFANMRGARPATSGDPLNASIDDFWAEYQKTAPRVPEKKKAAKSQPIASGAMSPPPPPPPQPVAVPQRSLADAMSMQAQIAGSVDPRVRQSDPRVIQLEKDLAETIRARRAAGERLPWER